MDSRLANLELALGPDQGCTDKTDISSRLSTLMRSASMAKTGTNSSDDVKTNSKRLALHQEHLTIDRLLSELALSPVMGPTALANSANNLPMVLRRIEILASVESMKRDMDLLARIRDLTLIGNKVPVAAGESGDDGSKVINRAVNCPIVSSERFNLPSDPEAAERLDRLCFRVAKLNQRATDLSRRADAMLNSYDQVMMSLSEKMVLAAEQIND